MRNVNARGLVGAGVLMISLWLAPSVTAQETNAAPARRLAIEEAVGMAVETSEALAIARAGVTTAQAQQLASGAERLPQLNSSLSYSRTLINQFSSGGTTTGGAPLLPPACSTFTPDATLPAEVLAT